MSLSELDIALGRTARYLIRRKKESKLCKQLATKLMSCEITLMDHDEENDLIVRFRCPRDLYEFLWMGDGNWYLGTEDDLDTIRRNLVEALMYSGKARRLVQLSVEYGAPQRTPAQQTELYMYTFGDDPVGQQVQVLDVGKHSAPTRQLLVSPVPVLPVDDVKRDEKLGFVMMPFAAPFRLVYDNAITPAVADAGLTCRRGDDISQPGAILTQIWQAILSARMIVADLSGANGNVLYELGLAHVVGHEAILLTQNIENIPFDLRHQRVIVYDNTPEGLEALQTQLTAAIQTALASSKR